MRGKILVTGLDLAPQAVALLHAFELIYAGKAPDETLLIELSKTHSPVAILLRYGGVSAAVMAANTHLKVISKHGTGIDTIDVNAAKARGIAVKAAVGVNAASVAEHTIALMLACAKSVTHLNSRMQAGHWDKATHKNIELQGKTIGLIGYGAIGQRTAAICLAMGMKVCVYDPFMKAAPLGVTMVSLEEVLTNADVLSLHCPLTADNHHLINQDTLAKMKKGAILINTARGGLVNDDALIAALKSGHLHAAGLDTFQNEPLKAEHKYVNVPNVILSPHIGGVTSDAYIAMGVGAAQNILEVIALEEKC